MTRHIFLDSAQNGTFIPSGVITFRQHTMLNDGSGPALGVNPLRMKAKPMSLLGQSRRSQRSQSVPLYLNERTSSEPVGMSQKCPIADTDRLHSITSSAVASNAGGMTRPSALAVLRLTTRSNLVDCSTGSSAGIAPCRIFSAYSAARLYMVEKFTP